MLPKCTGFISKDKKRRETFLWLQKKKNNFPYTFYKKLIAKTNLESTGVQNGGTQPYKRNFLVPAKAGVGILFKYNFQFNILKCYTGPEGRFVSVDVETKEKILTLVNIHAPNMQGRPNLFRGVSEKMLSFECDLIDFGGDSNLVCDVEKDKKATLPLRF